MEQQKSAVQLLRKSFNRTKKVSTELTSLLRTQVDNIFTLDDIPSRKDLSHFKKNNPPGPELKKAETSHIEDLFGFKVDEQIHGFISETKILVNDLNLPKSKAYQLSASNITNNKKIKKKLTKGKKKIGENGPNLSWDQQNSGQYGYLQNKVKFRFFWTKTLLPVFLNLLCSKNPQNWPLLLTPTPA